MGGRSLSSPHADRVCWASKSCIEKSGSVLPWDAGTDVDGGHDPSPRAHGPVLPWEAPDRCSLRCAMGPRPASAAGRVILLPCCSSRGRDTGSSLLGSAFLSTACFQHWAPACLSTARCSVENNAAGARGIRQTLPWKQGSELGAQHHPSRHICHLPFQETGGRRQLPRGHGPAWGPRNTQDHKLTDKVTLPLTLRLSVPRA